MHEIINTEKYNVGAVVANVKEYRAIFVNCFSA